MTVPFCLVKSQAGFARGTRSCGEETGLQWDGCAVSYPLAVGGKLTPASPWCSPEPVVKRGARTRASSRGERRPHRRRIPFQSLLIIPVRVGPSGSFPHGQTKNPRRAVVDDAST